MRIIVLSDTHGLLRPAVIDRLRPADLVLHAGDVGRPEILEELSRFGPVSAVRGNTDHGAFGASLPPRQKLELAHGSLYLLHDLAELELDPVAEGISLVVYGHSHRPAADTRGGVLFLNPGSIGPRRFRLPICYATVDWSTEGLRHRFHELEG